MSIRQFMAFRLSEQLLACKLSLITEVADPVLVNPVGGTFSWFMGIGARKGRLIPVSDLGEYVGQDPSRNKPTAKLLLIMHKNDTVALTVDEVIGLAEVDSDELPSVASAGDNPAPSTAGARKPLAGSPLEKLATGNIDVNGETASVIDLALLLDEDRFVNVGLVT